MNDRFPSDLPYISSRTRVALFLDFDGTLVDFADHPDAMNFDPQAHDCLSRLYEQLEGALAIITGRDIASVDRFLAPPLLPVAGVHGLVRRDAQGRVHELPVNGHFLARLAVDLEILAEKHTGLLVERKPGAVALHYRRRPDLAETCACLMDRLTEEAGGITLIRGKAVIEARADGADKGSAILTFLKEPPFAGRRPLFAGDDVTDEDGFARVNALGGDTIKVGCGPTCAHHRAPTIAEFHRWLCDTARHLEGKEKA